jgi:hypothetical protein
MHDELTGQTVFFEHKAEGVREVARNTVFHPEGGIRALCGGVAPPLRRRDLLVKPMVDTSQMIPCVLLPPTEEYLEIIDAAKHLAGAYSLSVEVDYRTHMVGYSVYFDWGSDELVGIEDVYGVAQRVVERVPAPPMGYSFQGAIVQ